MHEKCSIILNKNVNIVNIIKYFLSFMFNIHGKNNQH